MHKKLTAQGLRFLEEGQFDKASQILSLLISHYPDNAEAHHMLGVIELEKGNLDTAYILTNTALDIDATNSRFYNTMGNIELHRNNLPQAEAAFINAIKFNPEKTQYTYNLAHFYLSQRQYSKAIDNYYAILRIEPNHYLSIRGITVSYLFAGEIDIALEHANGWVNEFPDHDEAYYYQGLCLFALHKISAALTAYDKGLSIAPTNAEIIAAIAACYRALGNLSIAETFIHRALSIEPHNPTSLYYLGNIFYDKGDYATARDLYLNVTNLDHTYADPICGLGNIELYRGQDDLALSYFEQAEKLEPTNIIPKLLIATTLLRQQNFTAGWAAYSQTLTAANTPQSITEWQGKKLSSKDVLLVWVPKENAELSLQIMFATMLTDLSLDIKNIVLLCDRRLVNLFKYNFPDLTIISKLTWQQIDENKYGLTKQIALSTLATYYRGSKKQFTTVPLKLDPQRIEFYRNKYQNLFPGKKLIGVTWKAISDAKIIDHTKSMHLSDIEHLFKLPDYQFISLERSVTNIKINNLYIDSELPIELTELGAQLSALDYIVSVDNYIAHLAGSLGLSVYTLLPAHAEWYWFKEQTCSLWYPNMTIIRQEQASSWSAPISKLTNSLA